MVVLCITVNSVYCFGFCLMTCNDNICMLVTSMSYSTSYRLWIDQSGRINACGYCFYIVRLCVVG